MASANTMEATMAGAFVKRCLEQFRRNTAFGGILCDGDTDAAAHYATKAAGTLSIGPTALTTIDRKILRAQAEKRGVNLRYRNELCGITQFLQRNCH